MADIEFEKRIVDEDDEVGIPEVIRYGVQRFLRCARRITVEAQKSDGRYAKCNGFKLSPRKDNDWYPEEEAEEVAEAVMRCINARWLEAQASDPDLGGINFRVVFDQRTEKGERTRPSVELKNYSPDSADMPIGEGPEAQTEIWAPIIEQFGSLLDKLLLRIDGLIGHVLDQSKGHKDMFQPLVSMMAIAHQNQITGMEQQKRALEYIYSIKRVEEEQAGHDRRAEKWMKWLEKPLKVAIKQAGAYMRSKKKGDGGDEDDEEDDDEDDDEQGTPAAVPSSKQSDDDTPDEETVRNPLSQYAGGLGMTLRPSQWAEAATHLTKKQLSLFSAMMESDSDAKLISIYGKIEKGGIPLPKLIALQSILTERQSNALEKLIELIEQARDGWLKAEAEAASQDD